MKVRAMLPAASRSSSRSRTAIRASLSINASFPLGSVNASAGQEQRFRCHYPPRLPDFTEAFQRPQSPESDRVARCIHSTCRHPAMKVPTKVRSAKNCRLFLALPADGRSLACTRGHFIPSNSLKRPQRPELCSIRQDPIEKPDGFYPSPALFAVLLFGLHPRIVLGIRTGFLPSSRRWARSAAVPGASGRSF